MNEQQAIQDFNMKGNETDGFDRWLLDDKLELLDLQASLTGMYFDEETQKFKPVEHASPLMNEKGAQWLCWSYLYPLIKNAKVTWFDKQEVKELMYMNGKSIIRHLHYNNDKYALSQYDIQIVFSMVMTMLFSVFNRSLGGKERERLARAHQFHTREVNTVNNPTPPGMEGQEWVQKKKKIFGMF